MTINYIAKMAGVSRMTVSRVLHGGYVSEAARARVEEVIGKTGYVPDVRAQALRSGSSKLVGILLPALDSEVVRNIVEKLIEGMERNGYQSILLRYGGSIPRMLQQIQALKGRGVDGMILMIMTDAQELVQAATEFPAPVVTIGPCALPGVSGVVHNDEAAFRQMTEQVVEAGYQRIGTLFPGDSSSMTQLRRKSVEQVLKERGIPVRQEWMIQLDYETLPHTEYGVPLGQQVLALRDRPQVFISASDRIAFGVKQHLQANGIQVPQELAVTGAGNTELAQLTQPPFPTIDMNIPQIVQLAQKYLLQQMQAPKGEREMLRGCVEATVVWRGLS